MGIRVSRDTARRDSLAESLRWRALLATLLSTAVHIQLLPIANIRICEPTHCRAPARRETLKKSVLAHRVLMEAPQGMQPIPHNCKCAHCAQAQRRPQARFRAPEQHPKAQAVSFRGTEDTLGPHFQGMQPIPHTRQAQLIA